MVALDLPPDAGVVIHELTGGNVAHLEPFLELFVETFPQYAFRVPRLRRNAERPAMQGLFIEHQWLVELEGEPAAMTTFKYAPQRNLGLGIHLAVHPRYRQRRAGPYPRLSALIVAGTRAQVAADARAVGNPLPLGYLAEVEHHQLVARYQEYGFVELPIDYHEPSLPPGSPESAARNLDNLQFQRMYLGIFPLAGPEAALFDAAFLHTATLAFLVDYHQLPEAHWAVQRALHSIPELRGEMTSLKKLGNLTPRRKDAKNFKLLINFDYEKH